MPGDSMFIEGPIEAMVFGPTDTTNVYDHMRWGAVYHAAQVLAVSRGNYEMADRLGLFYDRFMAPFVQARPPGVP